MPAAYDYSSASGYSRTRADWAAWPSTTTPITQANLDKLDQAVFDLKLAVLNVLDFGAVADDSTNNTTAFANTLAALPAGGGTIYLPPGTYRGGFVLTANKQVLIVGYGATLKPIASGVGIDVAATNGASAIGMEIAGLVIDGTLGSATGIRITDTDRVRLKDLRITTCAIGVELKASVGTEWVEGTALLSCLITECTTGLKFNAVSGAPSFAETVMLDLGINNCTTGIDANAGGVVYRTFAVGLTIWVFANQTAIKTAANMQGSSWQLGIESFSGTGTVGVDVLAAASNTELWDLFIDFTGSFATKIQLASGKNLVFCRSTSDVVMNGDDSRALRAYQGTGDTSPRVEIAGQFVGGGGILFGTGGGSPDVTLYRSAADVLKTDDYFELTELVDPTAPATNNARLYARDNGSGKTQLVVIFPTGAVQVLATEP